MLTEIVPRVQTSQRKQGSRTAEMLFQKFAEAPKTTKRDQRELDIMDADAKIRMKASLKAYQKSSMACQKSYDDPDPYLGMELC